MLSILSMTNSEVTEDHTLQMHGAALHDHLMHDNDEDDDVNDDMHDHDNSALSKAEIRKSNKPIMEKRRRARINTCLNELKSLILDALKKDPSRHSKLEKADILEMTVKHLQAVQRQQLALAVAHDPSVLGKFKGGFGECAQEITRYISRIEGVDSGVRQRLMQHLSNCTNSLNTTTPLTFTAMAGLPMPLHHPQPPQHGDLNNNQARLLHRFVATRLAAAGDTAGAALILNGGLSLFARGGHPSPHGQPPLPPPPPQNPLPRPVKIVNSRACPSSSGDLSSSIRASAFTAVKRISNSTGGGLADPPLQANKGPHQYKVLAPTALRPVICSDGPMKTMVQAQVALKPMALLAGDEPHSPLDFSFRRSSIGSKRPLEDQPPFPLPEKMIKTEDGSSPASTSHLHSLHRLSQSTGPHPNTSQSAGFLSNSSPQSAGLLSNSSPQSAGLFPNSSPQSAGLLPNSSPQSAGLLPNSSPQSVGPYSIHLSPQSTGSQLLIRLSPQSTGLQDIIPLSSQSVGQPSIQNSPPSTSKSAPHVVAQKIGNAPANKIEMREESPNNSIDGEDKDMWRPW